MNSSWKQLTRFFLIIALALAVLTIIAAPAMAANNWTASYFNNPNLDGAPSMTRTEADPISYNWGGDTPAFGIIAPDFFSVRWSSVQNFQPGRYRFTVKSDDGARLYVNNQLIIDEWQDATNIAYTAEYDVTTTNALPVILEYYEAKGDAQVHLSWERIGNAASTGPTFAEYFTNMSLQGKPALQRSEGELYHRWGTGSPEPGVIPEDHFSARYSRSMYLTDGRYRFTVAADDGIRMYIDGNKVIDRWFDSEATPVTVEINLSTGTHRFLVEYYENAGIAEIGVTAERVGTSGGTVGGVGGGDTSSSGGTGGGFGGGDTSSSGGSGGGFGGGDTSSSGGTGGGFGGGDTSSSGGAGGGFGGGSGGTATIDTSYLNMRSGPGTQFESIEVLPRGTVVTLTGNQVDYWVEVVAPSGLRGWVSNGYLEY